MWLDTRLKKPNCNHCDKYPVVFNIIGDKLTVGYATWMPKNDYTDGDWINITFTNGNGISDAVPLYWMELPKAPNLI